MRVVFIGVVSIGWHCLKALLESNTLEKTIRNHNARILEVTPEFTVIEKTGYKEDTQDLFEKLNKYGVKQFTRSGRVAITRSKKELLTTYLKEVDKAQSIHITNNNKE